MQQHLSSGKRQWSEEFYPTVFNGSLLKQMEEKNEWGKHRVTWKTADETYVVEK